MCATGAPWCMSVASNWGWGFFAVGMFLLLIRIILLCAYGFKVTLSEINGFLILYWSFVLLCLGLSILITMSVILDNPCPNRCPRVDLKESNVVACKVFGGILIVMGAVFFCCCTEVYNEEGYYLVVLTSFDYWFVLMSICILSVDGSLGSCPAVCPRSTPAPKIPRATPAPRVAVSAQAVQMALGNASSMDLYYPVSILATK
jgi:hypothetical protein